MEKYSWLILRSILLLIAVVFTIYAAFITQPCDIDAIFLSCRLNGSVADIAGVSIFVIGLLVMSGVFKGLHNLYNPPNTSTFNVMMFAAMVIGVVLFWNL